MRYHYEPPKFDVSMYGKRYICSHPAYDCCTVFYIDSKGLAVIQQRFDPHTKHTWWDAIDPWVADDLYLHPRFRAYFEKRAGACTDGLYPTVTVRQIMWALKMKLLPKERWETVFDRAQI